MAAQKKIIKKPSFVIIYSICIAVAVSVFLLAGLIFLVSYRSNYDSEITQIRDHTVSNLNNSIHYQLNKENVTAKDIASLKYDLVYHYYETMQQVKVFYDQKEIADTSQTAVLDYTEGQRTYRLILADNSYLEPFKTRETGNYWSKFGKISNGFKRGSVLLFYCREIYVDLENCRFIPVVSEVLNIKDETGNPSTGVIIRNEPVDTNGYTLVKVDADEKLTAMIAGYSGEDTVDEFEGSVIAYTNDYGKTFGLKQTALEVEYFDEAHAETVTFITCVLVLIAFDVALIPALFIYNNNLRSYEIYEYRQQMTNAMAHDLKTPVASIVALAELLENNIDTDNRAYYISKISEKAGQINSMVNNILSFSRSENTAVAVNRSEVKIAELIREIIIANEQLINEKGLKVDFDDATSLTLFTDFDLLKQALGNLINNAVLYSKENTSVSIECNAEMIKITNVMAEPVDDVEKIREPFVKGNSSRQHGGTGLGLAIAGNDLAMLKYKMDLKTEDGSFICTIDIS